MSKKLAAYVAVVGLSLEDGTRVEAGEPYPGQPVEWLIRQGLVEVALKQGKPVDGWATFEAEES